MSRPFPGFQHLYSLEDPLASRHMRGGCDAFGVDITRGDIRPSQPVTITWAMGGATPSDFVWTTSVFPRVVHRRVVDLLQEHGLTGWQTYDVRLTDRDGGPHTDYCGLVITGRCGPADPSRSTIVLHAYPGGWYPHMLGHYFEEASWDGSDLFMEREDARGATTGSTFVTERVRSVFRKAKVRNVRLERLCELSVSADIYSFGREYMLPDDFARRVDAAYAVSGLPRPEPTGE